MPFVTLPPGTVEREFNKFQLVDGEVHLRTRSVAIQSGVWTIGLGTVTAPTAFDHFRKSAIGTTAVQLNATSATLTNGLMVRASRTNNAAVYIGNSDVTADTADATDGFELDPGEEVFIPVNNQNIPYARAASGTQKVFCAALNAAANVAVATFDHGRKSAIGTTAVQAITTSRTLTFGMLIRAGRSNTDSIFVGNSDVTNDSADATDGYELYPNESVFISIDDQNKVYVIAKSGSQKAFFAVA